MTAYEIYYALDWIERIIKEGISYSARKYFLARIKNIVRLELGKFDEDDTTWREIYLRCDEVEQLLKK